VTLAPSAPHRSNDRLRVCVSGLHGTRAASAGAAAKVGELHALNIDVLASACLGGGGQGLLDLGACLGSCARTDRTDGLMTTVVTEEGGVALGLVYSNPASLAAAVEAGRGVYHSRSKGGIWRKGDTSGAYQTLLRVDLDCDHDAIRFTVCTRTHAHTHTRTHAHTHTRTHAHTHTRTHAHARTHARTHTRTHTHTQTDRQTDRERDTAQSAGGDRLWGEVATVRLGPRLHPATPCPTPLQVSQHGDPPAFCHKQSLGCWGHATGLRDLEATLLKRRSNAPKGSYTARLFGDADLLRKKLVEEAQVCSPLAAHHTPHPTLSHPSPPLPSPPNRRRRPGVGGGHRARPCGSRGCRPLLLRHGQACRRRSLARAGTLAGGLPPLASVG